MSFLTELWLPIALSSVFVFLVSSVIHAVLPVHRNDYRKLPDEKGVLAALRGAGLTPGGYMFPQAESPQEMKSPEMAARLREGPLGVLTVAGPSGFNMGRNLLLWFVHVLIVATLTAYIAWAGLDGGASFRPVFQITGATAVLGFAVGHMHDSIWKCVPWSTTAKFIGDGVIYGLVTAATFAWLWPEPAAILPS